MCACLKDLTKEFWFCLEISLVSLAISNINLISVPQNDQCHYRPRNGEGNVFTDVCHSVHGGGGGIEEGCLSRGRGVCPKGCTCQPEGGVCLLEGVSRQTTPARQTPLPHPHTHTHTHTRDGHCRGRYASYWNASCLVVKFFLFH